MKRNVDLIRQILLRIEDTAPEALGGRFTLDGYDPTLVNEHVLMLFTEMFLHGKSVSSDQLNVPHTVIVERMTPKGHDFAELAKNEVDWEQARRALHEAGGVVSTDALLDTLKKRVERLAERATDHLTTLLTLEMMDADLARLIEASRISETPISAVFVDIDHFKKVNDSKGHDAGNAVLQGVAGVLRAVVSGKGSAYRCGGEEMILLLPNHSVQEATAVAERARVAISTSAIEGIRVTASLGIATFPDHAEDAKSLFKAADAAMYRSKARGRDLVSVHGEQDPPPREKPREVERKMPEPGQLPEAQRQQIRTSYFLGIEVECPHDQARLRVNEINSLGRKSAGILVQCPLCGFTDSILGPS